MQGYECAEADSIDLSRAMRVRGDAVRFFVDACKHRSGNAHPRWLEESADEDGETTNERSSRSSKTKRRTRRTRPSRRRRSSRKCVESASNDS